MNRPILTRRRLLGSATAALLAPPARAQRKTPPERTALVGEEQLGPPDELGLRLATLRVTPPPSIRRGPPVAGQITTPEQALLLALHRRGAAAGLSGVLYDNRDRAHSNLDRRGLPQLTALRYDDALKAQGLDYGLNDQLRFSAPVIGNSSTALANGPEWRSQARLAMTRPGAMARVAALYAANHIYVYPEHMDHEPGAHDLYPANTPCVVTSQGSSGSDRPFLRAISLAVAALRPDAQEALIASGGLAAAAQMALRLGQVDSLDAYMTAAAHPVVFDAARLNPERMVRIMQALRADSIPPAPQIEIVEERAPGDPIGLFDNGAGEALFDVGAASARLLRAAGGRRRYRLSAAGTIDPNDRALRFHWRALVGAEHLTLRPRDAAGREIDLDLDVSALFDGRRRRLEVALFADNGAALSAPALFTIAAPTHERRAYDAAGRLLEADYDAKADYVDPVIWPRRAWRDDYDYHDGALLGWRRRHADGREEDFAWTGGRVTLRDSRGRPLEAERMAYPRGYEDDRFIVTPQPTGELERFRYADPEDRRGEATRVARPLLGRPFEHEG